jgi:hypothetical protein
VTDFQDTGYIREISCLKGRFNSSKTYYGLCSLLFDLKFLVRLHKLLCGLEPMCRFQMSVPAVEDLQIVFFFLYSLDAVNFLIFSVLLWLSLNFEWFLFAVVIVIYVRYRQISEYYRSYALSSAVVKHNKISLWIGYLSCFGLSLVANFQETNVIIVHLTGAFLCFGLGTVYIWLQVSMYIILCSLC